MISLWDNGFEDCGLSFRTIRYPEDYIKLCSIIFLLRSGALEPVTKM
jgi:hypothetical protein